MAQKAHPTSLRPPDAPYQGCTHWNEARLYYVLTTVHKLVDSCCLGTSHYVDQIRVNRCYGLIFIETSLLHLHYKSPRRFKSRRYKENIVLPKTQSWKLVVARLYKAVRAIQLFTRTKKVTIRLNRLKTHTRAVPKDVRKQLAYYTKIYHNLRYDYARYGAQLMHLIVQNKASATSFSRFIRQNICTRKKRKKHYEFLRYIKQTLQALQQYRKIQGLKLQIKGRYAHKAKGRSRIWKYQMGQMPLSQLTKQVQAQYVQTQTGYGSVGIKIWICNW